MHSKGQKAEDLMALEEIPSHTNVGKMQENKKAYLGIHRGLDGLATLTPVREQHKIKAIGLPWRARWA